MKTLVYAIGLPFRLVLSVPFMLLNIIFSPGEFEFSHYVRWVLKGE